MGASVIASLLFAGLWCAFAAEKPAKAETKPEKPAKAETKVPERTGPDYHKLRLEYAKSKAYNPYGPGIRELREECGKLLDEGKAKEAVAKAEAALVKDKYNVDVIIILSLAHRADGNEKKADECKAKWMGVIKAILDSGDGRTPETAFTVISVAEEYAVLRALRLRSVSQALMTHEGHSYDRMSVKDAESEEIHDLYFNVDIPTKWLRNSMSKPGRE